MDPLSALPSECLHYILDFLANDSDAAALAALLQTNRYLATVTLPFLYKEPYYFTPFEDTTATRYQKNSRTNIPLIHRIPTRTLFNSLPVSTVLPKVVALGFEPVDFSTLILDAINSTPAGPSSLDYVAQIRYLHQEPWLVGVDQLWKWAQPPAGVSSFILSDKFENLCQDADLIPVFGWIDISKPKLEFYQRCFQILFFRESSWVMAEPILEQLQSLSLPLSIIARNLGLSSTIQRLQRLENFHFITDKVVQDYRRVSDEDTDESARARVEDLLYRPVLRFVKEHTRLFPGVMKTASSGHADFWAGLHTFQEYCPERILIELNRMLPVLASPTSLNKFGPLLQLLAHPVDTDLSEVVELDYNWVETEYGKNILRQNRHFLQRCRVLRTLKMEPPEGGDTFKWAVHEKRLVHQFGCSLFGKNDRHIMQDVRMDEDRRAGSTQPEFWRMGLVPLEDIQLSSSSGHRTDEINDAAVAFSQTLKLFQATTWSSDSESVHTVHHIGRNWVDLPLLIRLSISIDKGRLVIDEHLFSCCSNLVSIYLCDETLEYQCEDVQPFCLPAHLPKLESLVLTGWPALTFHPATLHSTPNLKEITLICVRYIVDEGRYSIAGPEEDDFIDFNCFIPPIQELFISYGKQSGSAINSPPPAFIRPRWTWDWHLPQLTSLTLSSEFAFLFEFRMLLGSPALKSLELEMRTPQSSHTRAICSEDLLTPSGDPIVVPSLIKLRMHGPYLFDPPSTTDYFPAKMFPNLESLSALQWQCASIKFYTDLVRAMPSQSLKEVFLDGPLPFAKEKEMFKLVSKGDAAKS
ncbi:hypothetical protein BGW39_007999 [Mortierella sp. 14UC]|nr:hypothetical protein BGW39_007999 [Mortierella sp. 14UC]